MFFYNKKLLREAGYDDAFIEAMPERDAEGRPHHGRALDIAKQVVDKTERQVRHPAPPEQGARLHHGVPVLRQQLRRSPNGNLLLERDKLAKAFGWFERGVKEGVIPANNTAMEFDALRKEFYTGNAAFWMYGIWDLGTVAFPTYGLPKDEAAFFADWGWIAAPAPREGRRGRQPDPSGRLRRRRQGRRIPSSPSGSSGIASAADLNTDHAVTTTHLGIKPEQLEDPALRGGLAARPGDGVPEDHQVPAQQSAVRRAQRHHLHRHSGRGDGPAHRRSRRPISSSTRRLRRSRT